MPIEHEELVIAVGAEKIAGTLVVKQKQPSPAVLFVHGWGADREHDMRSAIAAADLGYVCLVFDMRGHGLTRSRREIVSRQENLEDVIAAYDALARRPEVDPSLITIAGTSYGAYLASIVTQLRPIIRLGLRAPAIYRDFDWHHAKVQLHQDPNLLVYRSKVVLWNDNKALRACAAFRGHALIVESEHDAIVSRAVTESYARAFRQAHSVTRHLISGADHGLAEERHRYEYQSVLLGWLDKTVFNETPD